MQRLSHPKPECLQIADYFSGTSDISGVAEIETAIPALSPVQAPPYLEPAKHPLRGKNAQQRQIADFQRHGATFERDRLLKIGRVYRIMAGKNRTF